MKVENPEILEAWIKKNLEELGIKEPSPLAKNVVALVIRSKSEKEVKDTCFAHLEVFLTKETGYFVDKLFQVVETQQYDLSPSMFSKVEVRIKNDRSSSFNQLAAYNKMGGAFDDNTETNLMPVRTVYWTTPLKKEKKSHRRSRSESKSRDSGHPHKKHCHDKKHTTIGCKNMHKKHLEDRDISCAESSLTQYDENTKELSSQLEIYKDIQKTDLVLFPGYRSKMDFTIKISQYIPRAEGCLAHLEKNNTASNTTLELFKERKFSLKNNLWHYKSNDHQFLMQEAKISTPVPESVEEEMEDHHHSTPIEAGRICEKRNFYEDKINCCLEILNIPKKLNTISVLNDYFSKFGVIVNIQVGFNGDPEAALIQFENNFQATAAYSCPDPVLSNRFIEVLWHKDLNYFDNTSQESFNEDYSAEGKEVQWPSEYNSPTNLEQSISPSFRVKSLEDQLRCMLRQKLQSQKLKQQQVELLISKQLKPLLEKMKINNGDEQQEGLKKILNGILNKVNVQLKDLQEETKELIKTRKALSPVLKKESPEKKKIEELEDQNHELSRTKTVTSTLELKQVEEIDKETGPVANVKSSRKLIVHNSSYKKEECTVKAPKEVAKPDEQEMLWSFLDSECKSLLNYVQNTFQLSIGK